MNEPQQKIWDECSRALDELEQAREKLVILYTKSMQDIELIKVNIGQIMEFIKE